MSGHIRLNEEWFVTSTTNNEPPSVTRRNLNQMAAKVSNGAGDYEDLSELDVLNVIWNTGIGNSSPDEGVLFSTLETRYPDRLMLPRRIEFINENAAPDALPQYIDQTTTLAADSDIEKMGFYLGQTATYASPASGFNIGRVYILLDPGDATEDFDIDVEFWSGTAAAPTTQQTANRTITVKANLKGPRWYSMIPSYIPASEAHVWVVISTDNTTGYAIPGNTSAVTNGQVCTYNGTTWTATEDFSMMAVRGEWIDYPEDTVDAELIVHFNGNIVLVSDSHIYEYDYSTGTWSQAAANPYTSRAPVCAEVYDNKLYLGYGASSDVYYLNTSYSATQDTGVKADGFLRWNGYLVRWLDNDFYYYNGSAWSSAVEVGTDDFEIRGMSYMGDFLYISTDDGLWENTSDWSTTGIAPWPGPDAEAGKGMCHWQGSIYLPFGSTVYRYDQSGSFLPMGPDREAGLIHEHGGKIVKLVPTNNWLLAICESYTPASPLVEVDSIWAWNGTSWHFIAHLPSPGSGTSVVDAVYVREDADTQYLYVVQTDMVVSRIQVPDAIGNQVIDTATDWGYGGWIETDWWGGRLFEVNKDPFSVYVSGTDIDSNVTIYYMVDNDTSWSVLGTATTGNEYIYFDDLTRTTFKRIKLGVKIEQTTVYTSPIVDAVILRYQPMVNDKYRWFITVIIQEPQTMPDGSANRRDVSFMLDHIDSLINQETPFVYTDVDGVEYLVKVAQHIRSVLEYRVKKNGILDVSYAYQLTLDQVKDGEYVEVVETEEEQV